MNNTDPDLKHIGDPPVGIESSLVFDPPPTPEEEQRLLDQLPPRGSEVMVVRSVRLPFDVDQRVSAAASNAGVDAEAWIQGLVETVLSDCRGSE